MKVEYRGKQVSAKMWADGTPEPSAWLVQVGDPNSPRTSPFVYCYFYAPNLGLTYYVRQFNIEGIN